MNFDYTYITLLGYKLFEPMVLLTNGIFFLLTLYYFIRLRNNPPYLQYMRLFLFLLGVSTLFGAVDHTVHYQLGTSFFNIVLFLMNAFSLVAMYYCFLGPYTYLHPDVKLKKSYNTFILFWIGLVLILSAWIQNFVIIKVHAGIVLLYSLVVHWRMYKQFRHEGSKWIVIGIFAAFLPILVHSLKLCPGEWFNHKDLAHVLMIASLIIIYKGVAINAKGIQSGNILLQRQN